MSGGKVYSWIATLVALCSLCLLTQARSLHNSKDVGFDYLMLSQFWPKTSCVYFKEEGYDCYIPPYVKGWTIHGLWPSKEGSDLPESCNSSYPFDYSEIESLKEELDRDWHFYEKTENHTELWSHEWSKHGTCASSIPSLRGELKFFNGTIQLYSKLNIEKALNDSGITPSETTHKREDFFNAVQKFYKVKPVITCQYERETHKTYISEVRLCFNKTFQMMDCPVYSASGHYYDCRKSDRILYLPYNTKQPSMEEYKRILIFSSELDGQVQP